ncbi:hypothetical protein ACHAXA_011734 [Cyclostephanos tholiformis]|uniref:Orc1-like AAA ATPase domain-containing protein n=1 Tax=Cyclostephanos tholiformis TaxID=382380 RepID=A0ABD3R0A9_9STRA
MTTPSCNDVLFGRGFAIGTHPGNRHFRHVVRTWKPAFDTAKKKEKKMIAQRIVEDIKNLDPPGRFLIEDPSDANAKENIMEKAWVIVEAEKAVNKVMHRLRERERVAAAVEDPNVPSQENEKHFLIDEGSSVKDLPPIIHSVGHMESRDNGMLNPQQQVQSLSSEGWTSFLEIMEQRIYADFCSSGIQPTRNVVNRQYAAFDGTNTIEHRDKEPISTVVDQKHLSYQHVAGMNSSGKNSQQLENLQLMMNQQVGSMLSDTGFSDEIFVNQSIRRMNNLQEATNQQVGTTTSTTNDDIGEVFDHDGEHLQSDFDDFGKELDSIFREFCVDSTTVQLHDELTLRGWIERSNVASKFAPKEYIRLALSVALKLTECLVETETDGVRVGYDSGKLIPLASIAIENVILITRETALASSGWEGGEGRVGDTMTREEIEFVRIKCSTEDGSNTGWIMDRLFRLGVIFCFLFSGGDDILSTLNEGMEESFYYLDVFKSSINSTDLEDDNDESICQNQTNNNIHQSRPSNKIQRQMSTTNHTFECCVAKLESLGIPYSLCSLVGNLLDCGRGNFCGDDAFRSFAEVKLDLELMLINPSRFLDNIEVTNMIPSLKICDKLYGREYEIEQVESSYKQLKNGTCSGIIIRGEPGVGKSMLAMHVRKVTTQMGGYFLCAKFDQNNSVNPPLSKICLVFNILCDTFARDATPSQLKSVGEALRVRLGSQAFQLTTSLPSLSKLLLQSRGSPSGSACVGYALSTRFLFTELLDVISAYSMIPISIFFDDLQFADATSLSLLGSLVSSIHGSKSVFFVFCYRDNKVGNTGPLDAWIGEVVGFSLTSIKVGNLTVDGINNLLSDALHLSPRITRPLASVLLNKTRGNSLFLLQLIESLKDQGLIFFNLSSHRWAWDLSKVMDLEISNDVVALLIDEMRRLPNDLQLGLTIASCLGSCVKYSVIDILSRDLGMNLLVILRLVSENGFMKHDSGGSSFSFVHDKIEQAAKELMSEQQRLQLHMQLGLAICSYTLDNETQNDELFFMSVNQIDCGGKGVLSDPIQTNMIAALNLKAGKRAITYSDFNVAHKLFEHGISFLESDHWQSQYSLSLDLFNSAADAACMTNDGRARYRESVQSTFAIIEQCGEDLPRAIDEKLMKELLIVNATLQKMTDESILSIEATMDQRTIFLMKLYAELANMLHFVNPSLVGAVSLRLADLTLKKGLTPLCPLAFAHFSSVVANIGIEYIMDGCRLARLALKLSKREGSCIYTSNVIFHVNQAVLWAAVPLQAIADAHRQGHRDGERLGDFVYSTLNNFSTIFVSYFAGENLTTVRKEMRDFFCKMRGKSNKPFMGWGNMALVHLQFVVLQDGEERLNEDRLDDIPGLGMVMGDLAAPDATILITEKILSMQRSLFFRRFDDITLDDKFISDEVLDKKHVLRPIVLLGIFFEGLVAFQCARRENNNSRKEEWLQRGESATKLMFCLNDHSTWNWENKTFLLDAEKMYTEGNYHQAASAYDRAIRSANEHRFVHEEAIACELAGGFYYERNFHQKSLAFFKNSIICYRKWEAFAVARRLESRLGVIFGTEYAQLVPDNNSLDATCLSRKGSKKRQDI